MRDTIKYIIFVLGIILLACILPDFYKNIKLDDDEIWKEEYNIQDGSMINIVHNNKCCVKKPVFGTTYKILDYQKEKIDVYDYCINDEEADILNRISKRNYHIACDDYYKNAYDEQDYRSFNGYLNRSDTTCNRKREVAFSRENAKYTPQNDNGYIIADYAASVKCK